MDDTQVRQALREHVMADEPPLGLTATEVVAAGRRSWRRHAYGVAGGAVVVAAVAAVLPMVVVGPGAEVGPGDPQVLPPVELGSGPDCAAGRRPEHAVDPASGTMTPEAVEWSRYAISCYLQQVVPALLPPEATLDPPRLEAIASGIPTAIPSLPPGQTQPPADSQVELYATGRFLADAYVVDDAGTGSFSFTLSVIDPKWDERELRERMCREDTEECTVSEAADGALVLARQAEETDTGYVINLVEVFTGRTHVYVNSTNVGLTESGMSLSPPPTTGDYSEIARPQPPFTVDQLIEIAAAADLRLFQ